ncbi:MAG: hypothetical protein J6D20_06605 [Clostridia bacterium]|nr:hypothetical protein [Clostridia bacterium]
MKQKTKILITAFILCFIMSFAFSVSANNDTEVTVDQSGLTQESESTENDFTENPFALIYDTTLMYASEILSLMSFIGTLIISYFYRRGLLPSVKGVLGNMSTSVMKLKETSDKEIESRKEENTKIEKRLDVFDSALKNQSELISSLESRLIAEEDIYKQRERSNLILSSQIEMLYEIFMSSSLPQYQKEAMGEKINKMRKELCCYENEQTP